MGVVATTPTSVTSTTTSTIATLLLLLDTRSNADLNDQQQLPQQIQPKQQQHLLLLECKRPNYFCNESCLISILNIEIFNSFFSRCSSDFAANVTYWHKLDCIKSILV